MGKLMELGKVYHLYDHAVNKNNLFDTEDNFRYFLSRYQHFMLPVVDTMAYCLMPNHFHAAIRVKTPEYILQSPPQLLEQWALTEQSDSIDFQKRVSQQFSNLFNGYTQALNKQQSRRGALFEGNFCRKMVSDRDYFQQLICYIHHNPVHHNFCSQYKDWFHSSFHALKYDEEPSFLRRDLLYKFFGGKEGFIDSMDNWKPKGMDF
jgi:putative transposase